MMVISSHHHGFMIEFNDSACAHSAIWIKAHALTNVVALPWIVKHAFVQGL
jgi:uncharacterized Fe-S cluster protein YjdI